MLEPVFIFVFFIVPIVALLHCGERVRPRLSATETRRYVLVIHAQCTLYSLVCVLFIHLCVLTCTFVYYYTYFLCSSFIIITINTPLCVSYPCWEVIFLEHGFTGSGARKPQREFEGNALEPFFMLF